MLIKAFLAVRKEGERTKGCVIFNPPCVLWLKERVKVYRDLVSVFCPPRSLKHAVANIDTPLHTFSYPPLSKLNFTQYIFIIYFSYIFLYISSFWGLQQKPLSSFTSPAPTPNQNVPSCIHPCLTYVMNTHTHTPLLAREWVCKNEFFFVGYIDKLTRWSMREYKRQTKRGKKKWKAEGEEGGSVEDILME